VEEIPKIIRRRLFVAFPPNEPYDFVVAAEVHFGITASLKPSLRNFSKNIGQSFRI
jgi:hypothetical protein